MTISVSANNARVRYTATSSQTAFAIPFEFTDNDEITVFVATTALVAAAERGQGTGSTEYGISGGGGATGAIAFVTGITQGHIVTIVRDIPIERTTDFTAGTTINRAALNTQLDNITAMIGDLKDKSDRAIRLQPYDSEITLFLPTIGSRAGKIFGFDTNGNLTADTSANFDITLDDVVTNTITMGGNVNSKFDIIAVSDSRLTTNGAVLDIKSTKNGNTADIKLDGSATYGIDLNAGNKAIRLQDATLFSSTVEVSGVSTLASVTTAAINSLSGGDISLKALGNQVNILGIGGQNRITFHNPSAPSMEFFGDSSIIGSGSFLLDIVDGIILDSAAGEILLKDAGVLRMTIGFNASQQTITSAGDLTIASSASGINIKPASASTDFLATNGTQTIGIISSVVTPHLKWYQNSNQTLLKVVDPSATRTLLLPNESGTIHSSGGATTHANITVSTNGKVQFRDSAIYIQSGADGHLDLVADTEIQIAATTVNVDGLMDISGNLSVGGNLDVTGTIDFSDSSITNVGSITLDRIASDSSSGINLDSGGPIIIDSGNGQALFKQNGATRLTFTHTASGLQTLTAAGIFSITATADINLRPNGGQLYILRNNGGDNFQFNTSATPTLAIHQNGNRTNLGLVNPTGTRNILFPDASDTLVGKATTDTLTNKTLTAPTLTGTTVVASLDISGNIDVDGTTNLDAVNIDGAVDMASTLQLDGAVTLGVAGTSNGFINSPSGIFINIDSDNNSTDRFFDIRKDSADGSGALLFKVAEDGAVTIPATALVTGVLTTTAATVFNGGFAATKGSTVIAADGVADNAFAFQIKNEEATNDRSFGLLLNAGSSANDRALTVNTHDGATALFYVQGNGQSLFTDGTASLPSITNLGDPNTGMFFSASDEIGLSTAGTRRLKINANGTMHHQAANNTIMIHESTNNSSVYVQLKNTNNDRGFVGYEGTELAFYNSDGTNAIKNLKIQQNKDVNVTGGNLVIGTSGKGINFQSYGSGTNIDSNLLDDYEEGTFTPTLSIGGTALASTGGVGRYTKIGRTVYIEGSVTRNTADGANGTLLIHALPFTILNANSIGVMGAGTMWMDAGGPSTGFGDTVAFVYAAGGNTYFQGVRSTSTGAEASTRYAQAQELSSGRYVYFNFSYIAA